MQFQQAETRGHFSAMEDRGYKMQFQQAETRGHFFLQWRTEGTQCNSSRQRHEDTFFCNGGQRVHNAIPAGRDTRTLVSAMEDRGYIHNAIPAGRDTRTLVSAMEDRGYTMQFQQAGR